MEYKVAIGEKIKQLRKEKNLSQEKLAQLCSIDRAELSRVEGGKYNSSLDYLEKILNALGKTIDEIKIKDA